MLKSSRTSAWAVAVCVAALGATIAVNGRQAPAPAEPAKAKAPAQATPKHVMVTPDDLKWGPAPPSLPAGAQLAVLDGDPTKAGAFSIRVKLPDGYKVAPHWHPTEENLVILSGVLSVGMGNKWDDAAMHAMPAGSYTKMPRRTNHYVVAKGETVFQLYGTGPFVVTYVDPKDDPRKKTME